MHAFVHLLGGVVELSVQFFSAKGERELKSIITTKLGRALKPTSYIEDVAVVPPVLSIVAGPTEAPPRIGITGNTYALGSKLQNKFGAKYAGDSADRDLFYMPYDDSDDLAFQLTQLRRLADLMGWEYRNQLWSPTHLLYCPSPSSSIMMVDDTAPMTRAQMNVESLPRMTINDVLHVFALMGATASQLREERLRMKVDMGYYKSWVVNFDSIMPPAELIDLDEGPLPERGTR